FSFAEARRGGKHYLCLNESHREPNGRVYAGSAVAFLLHLSLTLTAKMEDSIAKLKHFSKLDFQTKRKVINNGRPMPELKGTLQTKPKGMLLTPHSLTLHLYKSCTTGCDCERS